MGHSNRKPGDGTEEGAGISRGDRPTERALAMESPLKGSGLSRRDFVAGTGALLLALLIDVRIAASSAARPVKVGLIVSGEPEESTALESLMAGFDLFVKEQGAGSLKLLRKQAGPRDEKTLEALVGLLTRDDVQFLIGPDSLAGSEKCIHGLPAEKAILFVTHPSVRFVSGELCAPGAFRLIPNTYQSARPLGPWALTNLGDRAFLTGLDEDEGNEEADFFAYGFEKAGGTFANRIMTPPEAKQMTSVIQEIVTAKPNFVFASYRGKSSQLFLKQYFDDKNSGLPPLIGPETLATYPQPARELGKICNGLRTEGFLNDPVEFAAKVRKQTGKRITSAERAAEGYDIAQVILKASEKYAAHEQPEPSELIKIVEEIEIEGPRGKIQFDKNHEPVLEAHVAQWHWDGKALQSKPVTNLGVCRSLDFGCGRVGFPHKPQEEEEKDTDQGKTSQ